jgi:DNA-binding NtrC family response regulator
VSVPGPVHRGRKCEARETRTASARGRLLIVDPDPLTLWSLKTFLQRWFEVETAASAENAQRALAENRFDALIVADDLPAGIAAAIENTGCRSNPDLAIVRTVTGDSETTAGPTLRLEKPFELAKLARLLGVPAHEIPIE